MDELQEAELAVRQVVDLDRARVRQCAIERFSPARMAAEYVNVYRALIEARDSA